MPTLRSKPLVCLLRSAARVKDRQTNDLIALVANDDVLICQFAVSGKAWLFEVDVQYVGFMIERQPNLGRLGLANLRQDTQVSRDVYSGHVCLLFRMDSMRRVRNAVIIKPDSGASL